MFRHYSSVSDAVSRPRWLVAGLVALMSCVGACGQKADEEKTTGATPSSAQPVALPSSGTTASPALSAAVAPKDWWNSSWDQKTLSETGQNGTYRATATVNHRWQILSAAPFAFFMVGNSRDFVGVEAESVWAWAAMHQNCETGGVLVDDLTTEFGDRRRGAATIAAAREKFYAWAATQPPTLTLYLPVKLGPWDTTTGHFEIPSVGRGAFSTKEGALASETGNSGNFLGVAVNTEGTSTGDFGLIGLNQYGPLNAVCPTADGGIVYTNSALRWFLDFESPRSDDLKLGTSLPVLRMTSAQAQTFVARNQERLVVYVITVATTPRATGSSTEIHKSGRLVSVRITDPTGAVVAEQTY